MEKIKNIFTPTFRRWLYRVLIAGLPLLVAAGWVSESNTPLIVAFVGAILGLSVADANVPNVEYSKVKDTNVEPTYTREGIDNPFKGAVK